MKAFDDLTLTTVNEEREKTEVIVKQVTTTKQVRKVVNKEDKFPLPVMFPVTKQTLRPVPMDSQDRLDITMSKDGLQFVLRVTTLREGGIPSPGARSGWFQRIPAKKEVSGIFGKEYLAEATDVTVTAIAVNWKPSQVTWGDTEDSLMVFTHVITTMMAQERSLRLIAEYRHLCDTQRDQILEVCAPTVSILDGHDLADQNSDLPLALHQNVAASCALNTQGFAFFKEQGTGKTPPTIAVMCTEARRLREKELAQQDNSGNFQKQYTSPRLYRSIIVVPKNVRFNWGREIERFKTCEGVTVILRGGKMERCGQILTALAPNDEDQLFATVIMGYETLVNTWDVIGRIPWDLAVLDESHYIKTPTTRRTKFAHKLRDVSKKRVILTGTPITNHALDLWSQLEFLGKGMSGFQTFKTFKEYYGVFETDGEGFRKLISVQNLPFMQERLSRVAYVVRKEEALPNLPDKVYDVHEVEMGSKQLAAYKDLQTKLALEIEADAERSENRQLLVANALVKLLRLAQITSGFLRISAEVDEVGNVLAPAEMLYFDPNPKLDELFKLLLDEEKTVDDKTLIWASFTDDIKAVCNRFDDLGIKYVKYYGQTSDRERERAERLYNNDPEVRFFVGNAAAGGTGLNLLGHPPEDPDSQTSDTTHVVYYSQNWSSTQRSQSEDRPHRRGTRKNVRITDLVVPGTIDEEIRSRVTDKRQHALEVTNLQSLLQRVLGVSDVLLNP